MIVEFLLKPRKPGTPPLVLRYRPRKNLVAIKYFDLVRTFVSKKMHVDEELSYWNFLLERDQKEALVKELQEHLDVMKQEPKIDMSYTVSFNDDQSLLNEIHDKFEFYLKQLQSEQLVSKFSDHIRSSLLQINLLIHKLENFNGIQKQILERGYDKVDCAFGYRFQDDEFHNLEEHDYDHFTLDRPFGSLSCGYNTTGKNFLHVMNDNDLDLIHKQKVSPQRTFSTEGYFWFGPSIDGNMELKRLYDWWDRENVESFGYRKYDRKNSVGLLPLADLIEPQVFDGKSHWEKLLILNQYSGISEVRFSDS